VHLVVVDDEEAVRDSLSRTLRFEGYTVSVAVDGASGLDLIRAEKPDGVLLDVMMPVLSGLDSCRVLRAEGNYIPVLMLTARSGVDDRVAGLDAGADDYLSKPFELDELLARMRAVLRRRGSGSSAVLSNGKMTLDPATRQATCFGETSILTAREFAVLQALLARLVLELVDLFRERDQLLDFRVLRRRRHSFRNCHHRVHQLPELLAVAVAADDFFLHLGSR